jgi:16S rRNA (guanine1207-N2)-methyltransferase
MEAHALLSRVRPDGVLLLFGARDEGIVSAPRRIEAVIGGDGSVATLTVKARCRVLALERGGDGAPPRGDLDEWARRGALEIQGEEVPWTWFPGLFAEGRLDPGTALLLRHLPAVAPGATVLDYGCGTGVIGATVLAIAPTAEVDLLDADALALEAARRNVPGARARVATWALREVDGAYDCIVSNPPFHQGKGETLEPVRALVSEAPGALTRGGVLALVTQRRLPVGPLLGERFHRVEIPAEDSVFRVWWASGPR